MAVEVTPVSAPEPTRPDLPSAEPERRPDTLAMRTLTVLLTPFVLTYLALRWTWSKLPALLASVGRLAGRIRYRIGLLLRGASGVVGRGLQVLRSIAVRVGVVVRSAASAVAKVVRPFLTAAWAGLRATGRLARELATRAFVILRAGARLLLRPVRWMAAAVGQMLSRALVVLRAAAHTINRGLRSVAGVIRQLGARAALLARAAVSRLAQPVRVLLTAFSQLLMRAVEIGRAAARAIARGLRLASSLVGRVATKFLTAVRAGVDMVVPPLRALMRRVAEPVGRALDVAGRAARGIARGLVLVAGGIALAVAKVLARLSVLGRRVGRALLSRLNDAKDLLMAWYRRFLRPPLVAARETVARLFVVLVGRPVAFIAGVIQRRTRAISVKVREVGSRIRASVGASARRVSGNVRAAASQVRASVSASARHIRERLRFGRSTSGD